MVDKMVYGCEMTTGLYVGWTGIMWLFWLVGVAALAWVMVWFIKQIDKK